LLEALERVRPFSENLLPDSLCRFVFDIAERMQVPPDYPAAALITFLSGAVGRRARIQPKASDTSWACIPNLWGAIVGPPGYMKSPAIAAVQGPFNEIEAALHRVYERALAAYEKAVRKEKEKPEKPTPRRLVLNDPTFEKLHEINVDNPAGLIVSRDELSGWFAGFERKGREGERQYYLTAWDGNTPYAADRIIRGTVYVPACCVSLFGSMQPERLRSYLGGGEGIRLQDDGLLQRLQLMVWPDVCEDYEYIDRPPNLEAQAVVERIVRRIVQLNPGTPLMFRFDSEAQGLFEEWFTALEFQVRGQRVPPLLVSHLSKYRSLMPSLALLFELADIAERSSEGFEDLRTRDLEIGIANVTRAENWCKYLESHARRVYSLIPSAEQKSVVLLAHRLKRGEIGRNGYFTLREVQQKNWSGLSTPEAVKSAVQVLEAAAWIRDVTEQPGRQGGRPSARYEVNPRALALPE
jgi:putative DNA primase/helicase